jgi:CheY-like chemotaxis protein
VPLVPAGAVPSEVRVLIVEDHWANRRLLEAMLKKLGAFYTVGLGFGV